ncbi:MAG: hypothetical protein PVS3B3_15930 [Ktedonobacteraceae bacterium]
MTASARALHVHFVRHEEVASHRGDVPLTPRGQQRAAAIAQHFSELLEPNEVVTLLHAPTQRTRETALAVHNAMVDMLTGDERTIHLMHPTRNDALRNPDLYVAGERVEMVSSLEALAEQLPTGRVSNEALEQLLFWRTFWSHSDRIGYWVNHPNPPGEDAGAVARRLLTFAVSMLDLPRAQPRRFLCVTHSPVIRAFLMHSLFVSDPGEPQYGESVNVHFPPDGEMTVHYRDRSRTLPVLTTFGE